MAKSDAERFADYIQAQGLGTIGTNIWVDMLPQDRTACIAVISTGGESPEPGLKLDYPTVQVIIRSSARDIPSNYNTALAVKNLLLGAEPLTLDGIVYKSVIMRGDINFLGLDDNSQPVRTLNFRLIKENESGGNRTTLT